jgi:hypothetical protein
LTADKSTLKDRRSFYEHRVLVRLAELLPAGVKVCIVADRGFGDQELYRMLTEAFASAATLRSPPTIRRPVPPPPGCRRVDAHVCCAAPRSPPIATGWEPWSAFRIPT